VVDEFYEILDNSRFKPCPFCGRQPTVRRNRFAEVDVYCDSNLCCAIVRVWGRSLEEALNLWNDRKGG